MVPDKICACLIPYGDTDLFSFEIAYDIDDYSFAGSAGFASAAPKMCVLRDGRNYYHICFALLIDPFRRLKAAFRRDYDAPTAQDMDRSASFITIRVVKPFKNFVFSEQNVRTVVKSRCSLLLGIRLKPGL